jgi:hypothetical protein
MWMAPGIAALAFAAAPAQANTVTIGSPDLAVEVSGAYGSVATLVNSASQGATLTAPSNGVITSWKVAGASGGPFFLQVVHPAGAGAYTGTATSGAAVITGAGSLTFPADLPIKRGDLVGLANTSPTDKIGLAGPAGSSYAYFSPPLGSTPQTSSVSNPAEIAFNAQELFNCTVPKLKGKKVGAARRALAAAGCAAPKVKKNGGKSISKQNPAAGTEIRGDAAVKLSAGPKK